ncbi:MAG: segregation and condensation protein A [Alphaproteobacteria bacterium]|nr:MAG: segregation and condensation protein A [Alphaproteobacteria bacterium]
MAAGETGTVAGETAEVAWDGPADRASFDATLTVDVDGFEGPLDLLLELARRQKVDLARISILALAEQYLAFIEHARRLRIEIAADYLVMAAWLAYLKSRLLLPEPESGADEPSGEEMAAILAFRLQRLEAMRQAAGRLINRNRLGRDFFARGMPEPINVEVRPQFSASLYDLLTAYAAMRQRRSVSQVTIAARQVWSLQEARDVLTRFVGAMADWTPLDAFLRQYLPDPKMRPTVLASSFAASLELAREGVVTLRQEKAYAPIYMRAGRTGAPAVAAGDQ